MIGRIFNEAHVIWQEIRDDAVDMPNEAIAVCIDNGGTIVIRQRGEEICLNKETVPDLVKLLKQLANKV